MRQSLSTPITTLVNELLALGLNRMAAALEEQYHSPDFLKSDRFTLLSNIVDPEYNYRIDRQYNARLKKAHLSGSPEDISKCVDSKERFYMPEGITTQLGTLRFIEDGMNVCILGASDSGKSYLSKAIGITACNDHSVEYYSAEDLAEQLKELKDLDFKKYTSRIKHLVRIDLLIMDDFLLHPTTDEREIKIYHEILNKRVDLQKSTIVCSQRVPDSWKTMMMNDTISSDAIIKRATKHYTVMIQAKDPS